jgi:hypothetical protein
MSIPCICVYNFQCVYLWGLKLSIVSPLSIISMPVAPGLHRKRTWHKEGLVTCYPVHEGGEIKEG